MILSRGIGLTVLLAAFCLVGCGGESSSEPVAPLSLEEEPTYVFTAESLNETEQAFTEQQAVVQDQAAFILSTLGLAEQGADLPALLQSWAAMPSEDLLDWFLSEVPMDASYDCVNGGAAHINHNIDPGNPLALLLNGGRFEASLDNCQQSENQLSSGSIQMVARPTLDGALDIRLTGQLMLEENGLQWAIRDIDYHIRMVDTGGQPSYTLQMGALVDNPLLGGTFRIRTPVPLESNEEGPSQTGEIQLLGAGGSGFRFTLGELGVTVSFSDTTGPVSESLWLWSDIQAGNVDLSGLLLI